VSENALMNIRLATPLFAGLAAMLTAWAAFAVESPLLSAAQAGDRDAALNSLNGGADPNERAADGSTALMWAAYHGDAELVERLLAAGADPALSNAFGSFALSEAAIIGSVPVIEAL